MSINNNSYNFTYGFFAALLAGVCLYRLHLLMRGRRGTVTSVAGYFVVLCFASTAVAFAFAMPILYLDFDRAVGMPNASTCVIYTGMLITCAAFQATVTLWTHASDEGGTTQPRVTGVLLVYTVVIATMIALFTIGHTSQEHPVDFDAHYARTPWIVEALMIYYVAHAAAMARIALQARRYTRSTGGWLHRGLICIWLGGLAGVSYCSLKIVAVVGLRADLPVQNLSTLWAPLCACAGGALFLTGLTMPNWGPRMEQSIDRARAYGQLYPLWRAMYEATPSIALRVDGRWAVSDLKHRLTRRMIEILDGRITLCAWLDPDHATLTAHPSTQRPDLVGERLAAAQEASMLAAAITAKIHGHTPINRGDEVAGATGPTDLAAQLRWLRLVSQEFARLPQPQTPTKSNRRHTTRSRNSTAATPQR